MNDRGTTGVSGLPSAAIDTQVNSVENGRSKRIFRSHPDVQAAEQVSASCHLLQPLKNPSFQRRWFLTSGSRVCPSISRHSTPTISAKSSICSPVRA